MKNKLHTILVACFLLLPALVMGQAPNLGSASAFVLFSSNGAVSNAGISQLTGKVGTNNGSSTNFGNVNGGMHDGDAVSALAAADLLVAYGQLNSAIPAYFPSPTLGNGLTLVPAVYSIAGAATLNLELILDGANNPNAVFIFQIAGPLSSSANAKVRLINGAQACNVYWKVEGLVNLAAGTHFSGTIIANNAGINMNTNDTLVGRALSIAGAITIDGIRADLPAGCGSPVLNGPAAPQLGEAACYGIFSSDGPLQNAGISNIKGDVGANVGLTTGFDALLVTGNIHPIPDGSTATAAFDLLAAYTYLNVLAHDIELLYPAQFGRNLTLTPHTYVLNGATTLTDTLYLNAQGNANAVFILKIYGALETSAQAQVVLRNGAQAANVYWLVNGAVDLGDYTVFNGTIVSQGAISLFTGATLNGRALTGVGAVATNAIDGNASIDASCQTVVGGPLSVANQSAQVTASVYPNPMGSMTTVRISNAATHGQYSFSLYNAIGAEVLRLELSGETATFNTGMLPAGLYIYRLSERGQLIDSGRLISKQ